MSRARRWQKPRPARFAGRIAAAMMLGGLLAVPLRAATTEYVVVDRHTGLAISGFDPVAYFIEGAPTLGRAAFELDFAGAVWRFRNEGNRGAFAANPEVYAPRFGGYDPVAVARGAGVPGNPRVWLIADDRLYLFYTQEAREAFAADSDGIITTADSNWPAVQLTLSP